MSTPTPNMMKALIILGMFQGQVPAVGERRGMVVTAEIMARLGPLDGVEIEMAYDHATMTNRLMVTNHGVPAEPWEIMANVLNHKHREITGGL